MALACAAALAPAAGSTETAHAQAQAPVEGEQPREIVPPPDEPFSDRHKTFDGSCQIDRGELGSPRCVYGDESAPTDVALIGDSHAMHFVPALRAVAERRGWRLLVFARPGCPIARVRFSKRCDDWRRAMLRRIRDELRPELAIASTATRYRVIRRGRRIGRRKSQRYLIWGLRRTFRGLRARRIRVTALRGTPRAPGDVPSCVLEHIDDLGACAFELPRRWPFASVVRAARKLRGVRLIEPLWAICPDRTCPAVTDAGVLVYRDRHHLTATFVETLAPWFDARLPRLPGDPPPQSDGARAA